MCPLKPDIEVIKVGESLTLPERVAKTVPGTKWATKQSQFQKKINDSFSTYQ